MKPMKPYRHGDVILRPRKTKKINTTKKRSHNILATGEVTGHSHRIIGKSASLFESDSNDVAHILKVTHEKAKLIHEEHGTLDIEIGDYDVLIQREYDGQAEVRVYD